MALTAHPCAPAGEPGLQCAVLVCAADGAALVPDHTGCAGSGSACSKDSDCSTCLCSAGLCLGVSAHKCPDAAAACPP